MTVPAAPYCKVLTQTSAALSSSTAHGNEILDVLSQTRGKHFNLFNIAWWSQPGLNVYTPVPHFKPYNSVLEGGNSAEAVPLGNGQNAFFPDPDMTDNKYPVVTWKRTNGSNTARTVAPDGDPGLTEIRVMLGDAQVGSSWAFQTTNLGSKWDGSFGATKSGELPLNGGVAFVVHKGVNDTPQEIPDPQPVDFTYTGDVNALFGALAAQKASDTLAASKGKEGDIRCRTGIWSVLLPGDNSKPPRFEKKVGVTAGVTNWATMHTFESLDLPEKPDGSVEIIVSIVALAGQLAICVGNKDIPNNAYVYTESDPRTGRLKTLSLAPSPAIVSGINGGNPVSFGIRRIGWNNFAQFFSTMDVQDALVPGVSGALALAPDDTFYAVGYTPPLSPGMFVQTQMVSRTVLQYAITLTSTNDDREPCAVKWGLLSTPRAANPGASAYIDYGPALTHFEETCNTPDFSGVGGNRGSDGKISMTFDIYGLDKIAAATGRDWRTDLGAYKPATFVLGNLFADKTFTEATRMKGYFVNPKAGTKGFHDSEFTIELRDQSVRLKAPAGFVDQRYAPISMIKAGNPAGVYGYEGFKYILGKAIDVNAANAVQVYMPHDWPPLADAFLQSTGRIPPSDTPNFMPPYGKDAASFINDVAQVDFAAYYPAGDVWIYGQFDEIVKNTPTITLSDGASSTGVPLASMTDQQVTFTVMDAEKSLDSAHDFNKFVVWGKPPEGAASNSQGEQFGVYIITKSVSDPVNIAASWERVNLTSSGQFFDPQFVDRYLAKIQQLLYNKRISQHFKVTLPFAPCFPTGSPASSLYWGTKVVMPKGLDVRLDGVTLRINKITITGDMKKQTVRTSLDCAELIGG